jgi:hypothetical protein
MSDKISSRLDEFLSDQVVIDAMRLYGEDNIFNPESVT